MSLHENSMHLALGLESGLIKLVDVESNEMVKALKGHTSGVLTVVWDDNVLYSGSNDLSIKIWTCNKETETFNPDNIFLYRTLIGHENVIS